jgi:transcriptional regulator with XRE-family HTH domain
MLGKRIMELRKRCGISLEEMSTRSGIDAQLLRRIEQGEILTLDTRQITAICDSLELKKSTDYANLLNLHRLPTTFKCYRVGLLQSGSKSTTLMFGKNYRSRNEFMGLQSCEAIVRYLQNQFSREKFRDFVLERDCQGHLELDSAFFLHYFLDILTEHFGFSKVIFNIRDCYSWINCMINFILNHRLQNRQFYSMIQFGVPQCFVRDKPDMIKKMPQFINGMLAFWSNENQRIHDSLPPGRSLVVRTHEIYEKIDDIAHFLEIPVESLDRESTLAFPKEINHGVLHQLDYHFLKARFDEYCTPLMEAYFPNYTLDDFLGGDYMTDIQIFRDER